MHCFILAGGFATRLWPLTEKRAKPLLPLAGKPILSHVVEGIPTDVPISVSTNAVFADDIKRWANTQKNKRIDIVIEDTGHDDHKLGALGAVSKWLREEGIDDDILLLAGDNYCECRLDTFIGLFRGNPLIAAHDLGDRERARQFGTVVLEQSLQPGTLLRRVLQFEEKPAHPQSSCVSAGWWVLPRQTLPILVEYAAGKPDNVGGIFEELLKRNIAIDCYVFTERWKDIGNFDSYMAIHRDILRDGKILDPTATVDESSQLLGGVSIGAKSKVTESTLRECIVFDGVEIEHCTLTRCVIDDGCRLKGIDLTGKMLRAGTILRQ